MMNTMKLPVGIDDFRKLRESDFYYVDKTRLIEQILQSWSEVTLFTCLLYTSPSPRDTR